MSKIIVTAESFGYGPIITGLNIVTALKEKVDAKFCFIGSGVALEQAQIAQVFDEIIELPTYDPDIIAAHKAYFEAADLMISSENIEGAKLGVRMGLKVIFIDNLFWMWDDIGDELSKVDMYVISESIDCTRNLKKFGHKIEHKLFTGPLRLPYNSSKGILKDRLLINFGGASAFLLDDQLVFGFYKQLMHQVRLVVNENRQIHGVVVCGGQALMNFLREQFAGEPAISFNTFSHNQYLKVLHESKYVMLSPGLGNFFEVLNHPNRVLFLPPINYSQYWQIKEYEKINAGFDTINWDAFPWHIEVRQYEEEEVGVNQVTSNVRHYIATSEAHQFINQKFKDYLEQQDIDYSNQRIDHKTKYQKDGVNDVVNAIIEQHLTAVQNA